MTTLQKTLVTATVAVLAGAGIYVVRQDAQLREQNQTLHQRQAPLAEQIQQLQNSFTDATNRLAELLAENSRLKGNPNQTELLKLRGVVTRLRNDPRLAAPESAEDASLKTASKSWLIRVNQLKQYVQDHPTEAIPEFQFLNDRAWLAVADAGLKTEQFETESDFDHAMQSLRFQAEECFSHKVTDALRQFTADNNGKFPGNFSELASYCSPEVMETLRTLYEIKPASLIPEDERKKISAKFDWFITRNARVTANTTSRLAILADGTAYWQSSP